MKEGSLTKTIITAGLAIAATQFCAIADISGKQLYPTGIKPQNMSQGELENILINASHVPANMAQGLPENLFVLAVYDNSSGIDFSNNRQMLYITGQNGEVYGNIPFGENGNVYAGCFVGGHSLDSSQALLQTNDVIRANILDTKDGKVTSLFQTTAQPWWGDYSFELNHQDSVTSADNMYTFGSIKSDSDNFTDYIEEITGTDKNDPSDYFGITNAVVNGDNFTIYYNGTNIPVSVMSTTNLGSEHSSVTNGIKNGEWTDKNITRTTPKFYKLELDLK